MYVPNLKSVASLVPEIIGGMEKILGSPKFLMAFVWMDPMNLLAKFEVHSFTRS